jgi:adenosylhomocysteine nucleosidase
MMGRAVKVLVTFAVETEFAPWCRLRRFRRTSLDAVPVYEGRLDAAELRVVLTGIGPRHATRTVRAVLSDAPDLCISSGLAGALKPEQRVGEILVARATSFAPVDSLIRSEESLIELAAGCGARPVEMFRTSDRLVRTAREKSRMGLEADAVEMESYAVLAEAARWGVPAVAIRAIGDTFDVDLPYEFDRALDRHGQIRLSGLLAQIAQRPQRLPALVRLGRQCRRAAASLALFLSQNVGARQTRMSQTELSCEVAAT